VALARLHYINPATVPPLALLPSLLDAGLPAFQLRCKHLTDADFERLARQASDLCHGAGAQFVVDDRVDIAVAAAADGVHLGADDLSVEGARAVVREEMIVGATVRDPATAREREAHGATYLGVGPVFATTSKDGLPDPIGLDGLAAVCEAVTIPVLAIAGITAARVPEVIAVGAHGVAVIGAIGHADDPVCALHELLDAVGAGA